MRKKSHLFMMVMVFVLLFSVSFPVNAAGKGCSVSMKTASKTMYPGQKTTLKVTVSGKASKVKWKTSNKKVATVSSTGKVTAKKAGTVTITAFATGKDKKRKEAKCFVTVKKSSLTLNRSEATIYTTGAKTIKLVATTWGTSSKVKWSSGNKKIATVNAKGKVTAKKSGNVTITAKAGKLTAKCKIYVKTPSIKLNKSSVTLYTSGTTKIQLNATVTGAERNVTWTSSDTGIATVNSSGLVTAKKKGTTTITATANGCKATCTVIVKQTENTAKIDEYANLITSYFRGETEAWDNDRKGYANWHRSLGKLEAVGFCAVDIDGDSLKEIFVEVTDGYDGEWIVVYKDGTGLHCQHFNYRAILGLTNAGICSYADSAMSYGYTKFEKRTNRLEQVTIANGNNGKFYINGKRVSEAAFDKQAEIYEKNRAEENEMSIGAIIDAVRK